MKSVKAIRAAFFLTLLGAAVARPVETNLSEARGRDTTTASSAQPISAAERSRDEAADQQAERLATY